MAAPGRSPRRTLRTSCPRPRRGSTSARTRRNCRWQSRRRHRAHRGCVVQLSTPRLRHHARRLGPHCCGRCTGTMWRRSARPCSRSLGRRSCRSWSTASSRPSAARRASAAAPRSRGSCWSTARTSTRPTSGAARLWRSWAPGRRFSSRTGRRASCLATCRSRFRLPWTPSSATSPRSPRCCWRPAATRSTWRRPAAGAACA
mmetsp:Transcript_87855/g.284398  ORF Transcript_87855/g.284398 Transcript_87855/m.284398 type:complete len:202 (-) Transcript_87855:475-1080(-)